MAGLGDIAGKFTAGLGTAQTIAVYLLYGLILGLIIWGAWYILSFNVKVEIHERNTSSQYIVKWVRGKFKKDKNNPGVFNFVMMKESRWNQPLDKNYVQFERRGRGKLGMLVRFVEDSEGRLQPIRPVYNNVAVPWHGWNNNALEFTTRNVMQAIDVFKKGDFWSKYGGLIQMGGFILMFVLLLVLFKQMDGVVEGLNGVANALSESAKNYNALVSGGQVIS